MEEIITLDYGSGGQKTSELIEAMLLPALDNPALQQLSDGAVLAGPVHGGVSETDGSAGPNGSSPIVFSTDSFVVSPWRFPGGDIGKLCVCGTVNDLSMMGAVPKYLSLSLILEEGFYIRDLKEIIASVAREANAAGVHIVTGDTKVVEHGKGDGIYINTSGIGFLKNPMPGKAGITEGDAVIVSGSIGCHGACVMMARTGIINGDALFSDCQPLTAHALAAAASGRVRIMRDPTRGGLATTLNEFTEGTGLCIEVDEDTIPIDPAVAAACDLLGFDPLYCACEGRMLAVTAPEDAKAIVSALRRLPGSKNASVIGTVTRRRPGHVLLKTTLGGHRLLGKLSGQQLPRIC